MQEDINKLRQQLNRYEKLEQQWLEERQTLLKTTKDLQQEVGKLKAVNSSLMKKAKHKRTSSQQHTFIFNQTNISSIYPMVLLQSSNWSCRTHIRGHLDAVRAVCWVGQYLVTGSDDYLVKIWEKDQPKAVLRQHLAPIYTICADNQHVYTAGGQGVIRKWSQPDFFAAKAPMDQDIFHHDCIWELALNPSKNILLSSSADGSCKLFQVGQNKIKEGRSFSTKNETPTSIDWIGINKFICGYTNNYKLSVYDAQLGKQSKQYTFVGKQTISQTNKVVYTERHKLIVTGHEDRCLRFFDPNSNKLMKVITGHSDAITGLCCRNEGYQIMSCGHDGSMRIWDLRKYRCVHDVTVHMKKNDEAALCLTHKKDDPMVAIGGADGHAKIFTPEH